MMTWIKSQTSNNDAKKAEPEAIYTLFTNHWTQALQLMQSSQDADGAFALISHLSQMIAFLVMSRGEPVTIEKSCRSFWIQQRCAVHAIQWLHGVLMRGIQMPEQDELKLIAMLHSLCEAASRDGELLGFVNTSSSENNHDRHNSTFVLASLLLEYSLRNTLELAETARYSFIQLIQLASKFPDLEQNLVEDSGLRITDVVVSGLSACFAQLPTFTKASDQQMSPFVEQLEFVDDVTYAAPLKLGMIIAECFTNTFLAAVIEPALIQSLNEEIGIVTFYLEVICRKITHPSLVKVLVEFVNTRLLHVLIDRLSSNESVNVVLSTLSLFIALLELYCEDIWLETILKYLTPQHHLMVSQRYQRLPRVDYHESATEFLSMLPARLCDIVGPEATEECFVQYINQVSAEWSTTAMTVRAISTMQGFAPDVEEVMSPNSTHGHSNFIFPEWKNKYDGQRYLNNTIPCNDWAIEEHESELENEGNSDIDGCRESERTESDGSLGFVHKHKNMTNNLENGSFGIGSDVYPDGELFSNHNISILSNHSDLRNEDAEDALAHEEGDANTIASFGPFLDSIFVQLSNWPHLDLDVILVLTQVISLLVSSRIPLVNSLILDSSVVLQPYYLTFNTLLKRIKEDLEYQLKDVPQEVLRAVWETTYSNQDNHRRGASFAVSLSQSFGEQFSDTLRRTISGGGTEAIASVWRRFNRKTFQSSGVEVHPSSGAVLRPSDRNGRIAEKKTDPQLDVSKKMAVRLIYFFHWLLELGAIAQQQCWDQTGNVYH